MNKISAVIITYNEEKNIQKCISSLKQVSDEIVVLDSFSTDNTEQICQQLGAKFVQHKFDGYGKQKNRAITFASHDWILSLDADEVLSDELTQEIIKFKQNPNPAHSYKFNRLNFFCGKALHHVWQPDFKVRLWKKDTGQWTNQPLHETFIPNNIDGTQTLKGNLLHYSFHSIKQHLDQVNKFSEMAANDLFERGKKAGMKIFFSPITSFIKQYILKAGFLDGFYGFVVAMNLSFEKFAKYAKLKSLHREANNKNKKN